MSASAIEVLLERMRAGDEAATAQLFRDFEPFLRGVVRRRLPARARARFDSGDIVQSAWASLLDGFREAQWRFADAAHFRAFLTRVVLCRLYDRARLARREEPLHELAGDLPAAGPRPSEFAQAESVWESLLARCPPEHRPVLRLRRLGFTCEEIGERVGLHAGSIRRIIRLLAARVAFPTLPTPTSHPPDGH